MTTKLERDSPDEDPAFISQLVKILVTPELMRPIGEDEKETSAPVGPPLKKVNYLLQLLTKTPSEVAAVATNVAALPRKLANAIVRDFFTSEHLDPFFHDLSERLGKEDSEPDQDQILTSALILSLPFTGTDLMKPLARAYCQRASAEEVLPPLSQALVMDVTPYCATAAGRLQLKKNLLCALCHTVEAEHLLQIAAPVPDRFRLVYPCLQTLQCPNVATPLMKQFAVRILHMELENGIRARQNLMDYFTISVLHNAVLQWCSSESTPTRPAMPSETDSGGRKAPPGVCYDDSQWLIIYLLRFLYRAFDFPELWNDPEFTRGDGGMVAVDFDESLSLRCANLVSHAPTLEVRAAAKLCLTYPLNWKRTSTNTNQNLKERSNSGRRRRPAWKSAFEGMVKELHVLQNRYLRTQSRQETT